MKKIGLHVPLLATLQDFSFRGVNCSSEYAFASKESVYSQQISILSHNASSPYHLMNFSDYKAT